MSAAPAAGSPASARPGPPPSRSRKPSAPAGAPDFQIEVERLDLGARHVAGVDEAGRGPLAGPVVAAAVILDPLRMPSGLNDSKQLTAAERERLFAEILASARVSVASASAAEIDRINIRQATLLAMTRALAGLDHTPCHALVDGRDVPAAWTTRGTAVIEGDARSLSIAAASIVAKVTRDRMMRNLCRAFPLYGFSRHMGYGTAEHRLALGHHGPCPYHRMTFGPLRQGSLSFD
ncbi:ribonuclease HII [Aureimonas sp. Leaf454]|nr:ribonuclease HII [Aureimonas sp. Leaf454]